MPKPPFHLDDTLDDSVQLSYEEELRIEDEVIQRRIEEEEDMIVVVDRSIDHNPVNEPIVMPDVDEVDEEIIVDDDEEIDENPFAETELPLVHIKPSDRLNLEEIVQERLPDAEYYHDESEKRQIYIHHTASSGSPYSAINWWKRKSVRVATFIVVAGKPNRSSSPYKDGELYQCFSSKKWAHHLGIHGRGNKLTGSLAQYKTSEHNRLLNMQSVGIEIANWGQLTYKDGKYYSYANVEVPADEVTTYKKPYQGFKYYHKYSAAQIESLRKLLLYLCEQYRIPPTYHGDQIFKLYEPALRGDKGIFTHTSVRSDKFDCHPQPELIAMLKSLSGGGGAIA